MNAYAKDVTRRPVRWIAKVMPDISVLVRFAPASADPLTDRRSVDRSITAAT